MLPTLLSTLTSAPAQAVNATPSGAALKAVNTPAGDAKLAETGGIPFAALLPPELGTLGGPAIVDGAALLAGAGQTGNPAIPTGKDVPFPAMLPALPPELASKLLPEMLPPSGGPAMLGEPKLQAGAAVPAPPVAAPANLPLPASDIPVPRNTPQSTSKAAAPPPVQAPPIDTGALSAAIKAIVTRETGSRPPAPAPNSAARPTSVASLSAEPNSAPHSNTPLPHTPASAAIRSVPSPEVAIARLPRSAALTVHSGPQAALRGERAPLSTTLAGNASERSEQSAGSLAPSVSPSAYAAPAAPSSVTSIAAQSAPPIANAPASVTAPQPTEAPRDFSTLIDRLVQARDAAAPSNPATVRTILSHAEFGAVAVRFDTSGAAMSVGFTSHDPAFAPAARAALAADVQLRPDLQGRTDHLAQHGSGSQSDTHASGNHSQMQSDAQQRAAQQNAAQEEEGHHDSSGQPADGGARPASPRPIDAPQSGLYV